MSAARDAHGQFAPPLRSRSQFWRVQNMCHRCEREWFRRTGRCAIALESSHKQSIEVLNTICAHASFLFSTFDMAQFYQRGALRNDPQTQHVSFG
jgi:hypothetical protein